MHSRSETPDQELTCRESSRGKVLDVSVVLVTYVPDASDKPKLKANHAVKRYDVNGLLFEGDDYPVEQAPQIKGTTGGERY